MLLDGFLRSSVPTYQHLQYMKSQEKVALSLSSIPQGESAADYKAHVGQILATYTNPVSTSQGGIQTREPVKLSRLEGLTQDAIVHVGNDISMNSNRILDCPVPQSARDVANKEYVDAISAGSGLHKEMGASGTVFVAHIDEIGLEFDASGAIRLSSGAVGQGLIGGSGMEFRVSSNLSHVTQLGTLESLSVSGSLLASAGVDASGSRVYNLAAPVSGTDAVNKTFLQDAIRLSAGSGLSSDQDAKLHVSLDDSLILNAQNAFGISSFVAGTGLSGGSGSPLSVNVDQSQVKTVGTLTHLTVDGLTVFNNTTDSSDATNGSVVMKGGLGVGSSLRVGSSASFGGAINLNMQPLQNVADPQNPKDGANRYYVDSLVSTAGPGLLKSLNEFSVSTDALSLELDGAGRVRLAATGLGRGLVGGSGSVVHVDYELPHVRALGVLDALDVNGKVSVTSNEESIDEYTGSIVSLGGMALAKSARIFGSLFVRESSTFDSRLEILGSMDATALGTGALIVTTGGLSVAGSSHFGGPIDLHDQPLRRIASPVNPTDAVNRSYVDARVSVPGTALSKTGATLSVLVDDLSIEVFDNKLRLSSNALGSGLLGGSGSPLSVSSSLSHVTSIGTLSSLAVNGSIIAYSGLNANNSRLTNVANPVAVTDAVNRSYVDTNRPTAGMGLSKSASSTDLNVNVDGVSLELSPSNEIRLSHLGLGVGLSGGSGNPLQVDASQTQITMLGTLASLAVAGPVSVQDESSSSLTLNGGMTVAKASFLGGDVHALQGLSITGIAAFLGDIVASSHLTMLSVEESADLSSGSVLTAGGITAMKNIRSGGTMYAHSGVTVLGGTLQVQDTTDASIHTLGGIYSEGNATIAGHLKATSDLTVTGDLSLLSNCNASGRIVVTNADTSTSPASGCLVLAGGIGVGMDVQCAGVVRAIGGMDTTGSRLINLGDPSLGTDAVNKNYTDSLIALAGVGLTKVGTTFSVNASQPQIISLGTLTGLSVNGTATVTSSPSDPQHVTNKQYVDGLGYLTAGTGLTRTNSTLTVNAIQSQITAVGTLTGLVCSGTLSVTDGTPSTSPGSGAVVISGGLGIQGNVFAGGTIDLSMHRITNVARPVAASDCATKGYVDDRVQGMSTKYAVAAATVGPGNLSTDFRNGSVVDGITLSTDERLLVKDQTDPKENGIYIVQANAPPVRAEDFDDGTVVGGSYVFVEGGQVNASAGFTTVNPNSPSDVVVGTSAILFTQFSGAGQIVAGPGISKSANTLSVNANLPHVVSLGTLVGLTCSGALTVTDETQSASVSSGSLSTRGGFGCAKDVNIGGNLNVLGSSTFQAATFNASPVIPLVPSAASHAASKSYVDSLVTTAGTGLTKTGTLLSVNASQTQITTVGTLTALNVSGSTTASALTASGLVRMTNNTASTNPTSGALVVTGGFGLTGAAYLGSTLNVTGATVFQGTVTASDPVGATEVANKRYVDGLGFLTAGTGLTKTGGTLAVHPVQTQITSVGTLTGLSCSGIASFSNMTLATSPSSAAVVVSGGISVGGIYASQPSTFASTVAVLEPTNAAHAASKNYVDTNLTTAGTGLTKVGTVLSVNASQTQVTSVGTLSKLDVAGPLKITDSTLSTTSTNGALTVLGGCGISGNLIVAGTAAFASAVTVPTPTNASEASTKGYVDALVITAGTGLTKSSTTLSVNPSQTQVTSVGTLLGLNVSGNTIVGGSVQVNNAQTASSATTGAISAVGGISTADNVFAAGSLTGSQLRLTGSTSGNSVGLSSTPTTTAYDLTLPSSKPSTNGSYVSVDTNGTCAFVAPIISNVSLASAPVTGLKMHFGTAISSNGTITFYATEDGTVNGAAVFSTSIFMAVATPISNVTSSNVQPWGALRSISADRKIIVFSILTGTMLNSYGPTVLPAPNGITVNVLVCGK